MMDPEQRSRLTDAHAAQDTQECEGCEPGHRADNPARDRSAGDRLDRRRFMGSMVGVSGAALAAGALATRGGPLGPSEAHAESGESVRQRTAVVIVDPYNDFLSQRGAAWPAVGSVVRSVGVVDNPKSFWPAPAPREHRSCMRRTEDTGQVTTPIGNFAIGRVEE